MGSRIAVAHENSRDQCQGGPDRRHHKPGKCGAIDWSESDIPLKPGADIKRISGGNRDVTHDPCSATLTEYLRRSKLLAERQATWDSPDQRLGFSRAKQAEERASALRAERLNDLFAKPADSFAGVVARLHAVLATGQHSPGDEFPWLQIRAAMLDLLSLGRGPPGIERVRPSQVFLRASTSAYDPAKNSVAGT